MLEDGYDFAYAHVEAPDEMGHMGSMTDKITAIENVDGRVVARITEAMDRSGEDYRLMILPDHPTPLVTRTHARDAVPFVIFEKNAQKPSGVKRFDEQSAKATGLYIPRGCELMDLFLKK